MPHAKSFPMQAVPMYDTERKLFEKAERPQRCGFSEVHELAAPNRETVFIN